MAVTIAVAPCAYRNFTSSYPHVGLADPTVWLNVSLVIP